MKFAALTDWLDRTLDVAAFDDVSNNGVQIARLGEEVTCAAFAVDASARSVTVAAEAGAQVLVVHHGLSWGGGIRRLTGGIASVVRAAFAADLAVYGVHIPLDAHPKYGNNALLAKHLGLTGCTPAFAWRGRPIGLVGTSRRVRRVRLGTAEIELTRGARVGVCSGGAGGYAEEARTLGCDLFVTGEADWGETVAAENCGMRMVTAGHYATEVFGVRALGQAIHRRFGIRTVDLTENNQT